MRNQLIYAADQGITSIAFDDGFLLKRRRRVTAMSILATAIMQTPMHQLFLVQCLEAPIMALDFVRALSLSNRKAGISYRSFGPQSQNMDGRAPGVHSLLQ